MEAIRFSGREPFQDGLVLPNSGTSPVQRKRRLTVTLIVSDNGLEVTSPTVLRWANQRRVAWHYTALGKPQENGNRRLTTTLRGG